MLSLGSALLITGRTARALTKRIPKFTGQPIETNQNPTISSHTTTNQSNLGNLKLTLPKTDHHLNLKPSSAEILAPTPQSFWDNKSILCIKDERYESEKEINFNPALDAASALGIATCIVLTTSTLTIKILGNKWDLDSWEDWRMFIQGGYLGPILIPSGWKEWATNQIPKSYQFSTSTSEENEKKFRETHPEIDPDHWEWKQRLDREWKEEFNRREIERKEWVSKRELAGKRIW